MFFESHEIWGKFGQPALCAYELQMNPEYEMDREPTEGGRDMEREEGDELEMGM